MELGARELLYRFDANREAPEQVRGALDGALDDVEGGARITVELLARTLVAACIRGDAGEVWLALEVGPERVRIEVSGEGAGFRLPLSPRTIDYFSFDDHAPQPIGWRSYLLDRLADEWGIDENAAVAWCELDHTASAAQRLQTKEQVLTS
jgi:hypothetical protein